MKYTLVEAEALAARIGGTAGDMLAYMCEELRRTRSKNRKLRHDVSVIETRESVRQRLERRMK